MTPRQTGQRVAALGCEKTTENYSCLVAVACTITLVKSVHTAWAAHVRYLVPEPEFPLTVSLHTEAAVTSIDQPRGSSACTLHRRADLVWLGHLVDGRAVGDLMFIRIVIEQTDMRV